MLLSLAANRGCVQLQVLEAPHNLGFEGVHSGLSLPSVSEMICCPDAMVAVHAAAVDRRAAQASGNDWLQKTGGYRQHRAFRCLLARALPSWPATLRQNISRVVQLRLTLVTALH